MIHLNPRSLVLLVTLLSLAPAWANNTAQTLPFTQNWTNAGLITADDIWDNVPGIIGYRGDDLTTATGTDPQTLVVEGATPVEVIANQTTTTNSSGGIAEFTITNPVVAFQGSGTADAPFLLLHLDTRGASNITVAYLLRDVDGSADNAAQPVALQFRVGSTGDFTNVPAGFVADASSGPSLATLTTAVSAVLPASANNQALVQVRIITANAVGADEWIGVDDLSVTGTASMPPSGTGAASPNTVAAGGSSLLTVTVTPGTTPVSTGIAVTADLTAIGGSATQAFVDDGTGGDAVSGDNIFSFQATVSAGSTGGLKSLPVSISDAQARTATTTIALTVQVPAPPSGVASVSPSSVDVTGQTLLTVTVTPGTVPTSTGLGVVADLTPIGGSATQALFDDGTHGDVTGGDNLFSFTATIPLNTTPGAKTLDATISDAQARTGTASTTLTVRTPTNPSAVAAATPSSVVIGAQTLLTVTVTAGTNPTSSGVTVACDLTAIGGSATQALLDDGANGDTTAGDGVFSFLASVPGATPVGAKSLPVVVNDAQNRTASTTLSLTVTLGSGPSGVGAANPSSLLPGAGTLLTVTVTPGNTPVSTGITAAADLTGIGGSATATLFDDGTNGDVTAADLVFSLQTTVLAGTPMGAKTLPVVMNDAEARTGMTSIGLTVLGPTPPTGVGLATPASVQAGAQTLLTVAVTPGTNPASTNVAVSVDLTSIGGSATQVMKDDGTGGDATSGDGTFSFQATVPLTATLGARTLTATLLDGEARTSSANISMTVTAPPTAPAAVAAGNPSSLPAGGTTLLTVTVTPGANPTSTSLAVSADLSEIGGSSTQAFLDDGLLGDVAAGDLVFSFRAVVASGTAVGAKSMPVSVADGQSRTASATLSISVSPAATSPVAVGRATPASVLAGGVSLIEVTVTPGANPTSTGVTATVDLRAVGGSATQALRDDGAGGDMTAGDGIFSYRVTVTLATTVGVKSLPVAVADAQARTAVATVALTVSPSPTNPTAVAAANPATVIPGGSTLLTVTVTPGTAPTSTGLAVTGDLTSLGGSATQAFRDDGVMGDATADDNVFSFDATVPSATAPATLVLHFAVSDAQARAATASVSLIVSPPPPTCGNSVVEGNEQCDDGNTAAGDCCSAMCTFEAATTVCRVAAGACDVAETCAGDSATCPADRKGTGVCRPAAGVCDLAESCDGVGDACPVDGFSTQVCRAASQVCDAAEMCDGNGVECPADANAAEETVCGESLACHAGACEPMQMEKPVGCGCVAGSGDSSMVLLGLVMMGLVVVGRRRRH